MKVNIENVEEINKALKRINQSLKDITEQAEILKEKSPEMFKYLERLYTKQVKEDKK